MTEQPDPDPTPIYRPRRQERPDQPGDEPPMVIDMPDPDPGSDTGTDAGTDAGTEPEQFANGGGEAFVNRPDNGSANGGSGELVPIQPGRVVAARRATGRAVVVPATGVRTVVTHPHTRRGSKALGRNLWYPVAGAGVVVKRWRDTHGASRYERMMRQAELVGNFEMLADWESRDTSEKQRRHDRVMDWVRSPIELIRAAALGVVAFAVLLLGLGVVLAIADSNIRLVIAPIRAVIDAIAFTVWFLTVYGVTLVCTATAAGIAYLWHTGRRHVEPPMWMAPPDQTTDREVIPDERAIIAALRNLNLAPLSRKFKEGWTPRWPLATGRDGKGYRTQLELPAGVTVEMINQSKKVLAHNLVRLPVEVWATEPEDKPGVLDLWVADQGILTDPVEPYPLLDEGECDYFKGVPAGVDQRGDLVTGRLMAANYAIAGTMGSGKTSMVIELLCGAMLDPLVDIEVYVMAFNVDYDPMKPRLSRLVKGDEDTHIAAAVQALRDLREEVTERGKLLAELGGEETKLTRAIAAKDVRMRPKVVVFDECQELFRHDKYGEQAKELAIKVMMKARKCGITLLFVTPAPSADSLPRDLAKTVSNRMCFAIGDHQGNDAILGTGSHRRGITAVDLVPGEDVGTAMASGFSTRPGLVRTHHIRKDKTVDQLTPIVQRALGAWTGTARADDTREPVGRDLLDDTWQVMAGEGRVKATDVAARLRQLAPEWVAYHGLTAEALAEQLAALGVPVRKVKGTLTVRSGNLVAALAERTEEQAGGQDDDRPGEHAGDRDGRPTEGPAEADDGPGVSRTG